MRFSGYHHHVGEIQRYLVVRRYDKEEVQHETDRASNLTRKDLLLFRRKRPKCDPSVVTYHPNLPCLSYFLFPPINTSCIPWTERCTPDASLVAYYWPCSLRDLLVWTVLKEPRTTYKGNSHCQQPQCRMCAHIRTGTTFCSTTTGKRFYVKATANCCIMNVVYLIECRRCAIQYIGETEMPSKYDLLDIDWI